jgi:hypothetical protein
MQECVEGGEYGSRFAKQLGNDGGFVEAVPSQPRLDFSGGLRILAPFIGGAPALDGEVRNLGSRHTGAVQPQQNRLDRGVAMFMQGALLQSPIPQNFARQLDQIEGPEPFDGGLGSNLVDHHAADDLEVLPISPGSRNEGSEKAVSSGGRVSALLVWLRSCS